MFWSRPDAKPARDVPSYRRLMPYLMRGVNESAVYFDLPVDVTLTRSFIAVSMPRTPTRASRCFTSCFWAAVQTLHAPPAVQPLHRRRPALGARWDLDLVLGEEAPRRRFAGHGLEARFDPGEDFEAMVDALYAGCAKGAATRRATSTRRLGAVLALPGPACARVMALSKVANALGMLPKSFIDGDPMYASLFIANLASLKMDAGYHHLYEYGNIPIFCVIGQIKDVPAVHEGQLTTRPIATLRFSYDERVEDGLYAQRSMELLKSYGRGSAGARRGQGRRASAAASRGFGVKQLLELDAVAQAELVRKREVSALELVEAAIAARRGAGPDARRDRDAALRRSAPSRSRRELRGAVRRCALRGQGSLRRRRGRAAHRMLAPARRSRGERQTASSSRAFGAPV